MVFSSFEFLCIFLPVLCIVYAILPSMRWKNGLLIIGSLLFYAYGEPIYVLLMIGSSLVHYLLAMGISKSASAKKPLLALDVILSLVVLGLFKYTGMIVTTVNQIAHSNIPVPAIVMPIGISFFTFQSMSYVIDVYRGRVEVQTNFFKVLLYISFFPQLIAGPIVKYRDISKEIDERHTDAQQVMQGLQRFIMISVVTVIWPLALDRYSVFIFVRTSTIHTMQHAFVTSGESGIFPYLPGSRIMYIYH